MQVYQLTFQQKNSTFTQWIAESGKILESRHSWDHGGLGNYCIDPMVEYPDDWQDAQSSIQQMYWLTTEDLDSLGEPSRVEKVDYCYKFSEADDGMIATECQIGQRVVVRPESFMV
jgi:hypothetical protein